METGSRVKRRQLWMHSVPLTLAKRSWLIEVLGVLPGHLPRCEVPGALAARISPQRLADLRALQPDKINRSSTFIARGVDERTAQSYLRSPQGVAVLLAYIEAAPAASISEIYRRAITQLGTWSDIIEHPGLPDRLVKIVPAGAALTAHSPFFTDPAQLDEAAGRGLGLSEYFGLPLASRAEIYDVYEIRRERDTQVIVSHVAPTEELGGDVHRAGGAMQYILPDRSAWSEPQKIGQRPELAQG